MPLPRPEDCAGLGRLPGNPTVITGPQGKRGFGARVHTGVEGDVKKDWKASWSLCRP